MKWQDIATQDLKKYRYQKESLTNLLEKISILRLQYESVRCNVLDGEIVKGNGKRTEDFLLDNITQRKRLSLTYQASRRLVRLIERGLESLSDTDRLVLDAFYINKPENHIEFLIETLQYERAQIYRIKDEALYKFTIAMYGMEDY